MRVFLIFAVLLAFSGMCVSAQEVHVSAQNGIVTLTAPAQKPYTLMGSSQSRVPILSLACQRKGKKSGHSIVFSPGSALAQKQFSTFGSTATVSLEITLEGHRQATAWVSAGSADDYAYFGKTEPERVQFLQALWRASALTIEFTPFLTGIPVSSTFDLTTLRAEFDKHPECTME